MKNMACVSWKDTAGGCFLLCWQKSLSSVRTINGTSIPTTGSQGRCPRFVWHSAFLLASQCVCVIYFMGIGNEQGVEGEFGVYKAVWMNSNEPPVLSAGPRWLPCVYKYGWCFKNLWQSSFPQREHYWLLKPDRVLLGNYCRFGPRWLQ